MLLRAGERPVNELSDLLGIPQPGTSKHFRVLREVGLVRDGRAGRQRLYGLDARGLRAVHEWAGGFAGTRIEMRTVFATKELRDEAVEKYHAIEGGQQTMSKLAGYVIEALRPAADD